MKLYYLVAVLLLIVNYCYATETAKVKSGVVINGETEENFKLTTFQPEIIHTSIPNTSTTTIAPAISNKTTTKPPVTTIKTASTTSTPAPTVIPGNVSTAVPSTALPPNPHNRDRKFDGPSFIGGIVLACGLTAIGFVAFKFYKARTERNYHTL